MLPALENEALLLRLLPKCTVGPEPQVSGNQSLKLGSFRCREWNPFSLKSACLLPWPLRAASVTFHSPVPLIQRGLSKGRN